MDALIRSGTATDGPNLGQRTRIEETNHQPILRKNLICSWYCEASLELRMEPMSCSNPSYYVLDNPHLICSLLNLSLKLTPLIALSIFIFAILRVLFVLNLKELFLELYMKNFYMKNGQKTSSCR